MKDSNIWGSWQGFQSGNVEDSRYGNVVYASGKQFLPSLSPKQLEQLYLGVASGVDTSIYLNADYSYLQMEQIRLGLEKGLNVKFYARPEVETSKMEYVRKCMECNLPIENYDIALFTWEQIFEIYRGMYDGVDVSKYDDPSIDYEEMKRIRLELGSSTGR